MIDIETIGVGVDTSGVKGGTKALDDFGKSADAAGVKADRLGKQTKDQTEKFESLQRQLQNTVRLMGQGISAQEAMRASSLAAAGATNAQIDSIIKLERQVKSMQSATDTATASFSKFMVQIGAGVAFAGFLKAIVDTEMQFQKLQNTMKFASGGMEQAGKDIDFLRNVSDKLGLNLLEAGKGFAQLNASAIGTSLQGQKIRDIFEAVSKASTVMGMSVDDTNGVLRALSQMISKGTVQSEELRGQLGERLPGAFQIAARSMGVTTAELNKMLEQGRVVADDFLPKFAAELTKTLGDNPDSAANSAQAQLNRLTNAWNDFKLATAESGVMTIVLNVVEGSSNALKWFDHFVFDKGELADSQRRLNNPSRISQLRQEQALLVGGGNNLDPANTLENRQRRLAEIANQLRELEQQIGIKANGNAVPGMGAVGSDVVMPLTAGSQIMADSGKKTGGGWGTDIKALHQAQAAAVKQHAEELKKLTANQQEYMRSVGELGAAIFKVSEPEKTNLDLLQARLDTMQQIPPVIREVLQTQLDYAKALEQETHWHEVMVDALDREIEMQNELEEALRSQNAARDEALSKYADDITREQEDLNVEMIANDQDRVNAQIELERQRKIDYLRSLDDQTEATHAAIEVMIDDTNRLYDDKRLKAYRDAHKSIWESIERTAHDTFISIFDSGKSAFDRLRDALKNGLLDLLYQMTIKKWIINISTAVSGAGAADALAAGESGGMPTGGGIGSLSSVFDVFSKGLETANATFLEGIENFGSSVAKLGGVFEDVGGWIGENSALLGDIAPFVPSVISLLKGDVKGAIASGIGAGIGMAIGGPVGGMIGSALGSFVGSMFGDHVSRPKYYANTMVSATGSSTLNSFGNSDAKGTGGGVAIKPGLSLGDSVNQIAAALGGSVVQGFVLGTKYMQKYNSLEVTVGKAITKSNHDFLALLGNETQSQGIAPMTFFLAVKRGFVELDPYMKRIIDATSVTIDNAAATLTSLGELKQLYDNLAMLPPVFGKINDMIESFASLSDLDSLKALTTATQNFYSLFTTDAQKVADNSDYVHKQLAALGVAFPDSREGFRSLVEGIDTTTQAGASLFTALVNLAGPMDSYYKSLEAQAAMLDKLSSDRYATLVDYTRAQRYAATGIDISKLPSYDVGTGFVPADGPAMIHQGERILPRDDNAELMARLRDPQANVAVLVAEIRQLRSEINAGLYSVATNTNETAKIQRKWDGDGIPAERTLS